MAQIDVGNFGQRVARPQSQGAAAPDITQVSQAAQRLVGNVQNDAVRVSLDLKDKERQIKETEAVTGQIRYQTQLETLQADLKLKHQKGELSYDQLESAYTQGKSQLQKPKADGLDPVFAARLEASNQQDEMRFDSRFRDYSAGATQDAMKVSVVGLMDEMGKQSSADPNQAGYLNKWIDSPELEEKGRLAFGEEWALKKQAFKEQTWQNQLQERMIQAGDDLGALRAIEKDLTSRKGMYADKIDSGKRLSYQDHITGQISRIEQKNEMLAMKREMRAQNLLSDIDRQNVTGIAPPPELEQDWMATAQGTQFEEVVKQKLQQGQQIRSFLTKPIDQQQAVIAQMEANQATAGASVEEQQRLNSLRAVFDGNKKMLTESPLIYAQQRLAADIQPIDVDQIETTDISATLADRMATLQSIQQKHGPEVKANLLLPQEAEQLTAKLKQATPEKQAQLLASLANGSGQAYTSILAQVAKDENLKPLASAGFLKAQGKDADADYILRGMQKIADKTVPTAPRDKVAKSLPQSVIESMKYDQKQLGMAIDIAHAYYEGQAQGVYDKDMGVDSDVLEQVITRTIGQPEKVGRGYALMPPDVDTSEYKDKLLGATRYEFNMRDMNDYDPDDYSYAAGVNQKGERGYWLMTDGGKLQDKEGNGIFVTVY